jgi:ribosomal protein S18 acetylase RimI-like enzyme
MDYVIRPLTAADEPLLREMLGQGLRTAEDESGVSPEIEQHPELAHYVEGWGRPGDAGFVAHDKKENKPVGAVWIRLPMSERRDEEYGVTPELAFAVKPSHRRHGIGAALLTQLVKANPEQSTILISAPASNPAVRLYERFGFKVVRERPDSVVMRREA